jgi:hypothetical protein
MNSGDSKSYDYNQKKKIVYRIQNLKKRKFYIKLFKLILQENIDYTTNNNGVFINISKIQFESLKKIENFLNNYEKKYLLDSTLSDSSESISENSLNISFNN